MFPTIECQGDNLNYTLSLDNPYQEICEVLFDKVGNDQNL